MLNSLGFYAAQRSVPIYCNTVGRSVCLFVCPSHWCIMSCHL